MMIGSMPGMPRVGLLRVRSDSRFDKGGWGVAVVVASSGSSSGCMYYGKSVWYMSYKR